MRGSAGTRQDGQCKTISAVHHLKRISDLLILLTALVVILVAILNDDSVSIPLNPYGRRPLSNSSPVLPCCLISSKAAACGMSSGMYGEYFAETSCV